MPQGPYNSLADVFVVKDRTYPSTTTASLLLAFTQESRVQFTISQPLKILIIASANNHRENFNANVHLTLDGVIVHDGKITGYGCCTLACCKDVTAGSHTVVVDSPSGGFILVLSVGEMTSENDQTDT